MNLGKFIRVALIAAAVSLAALAVKAARVVYNTTLVGGSVLSTDNTYVLDLGNSNLPGSNIDQLSMQAAYSSSTVSAVSFNDGTPSTGTITIATSTYSQAALVGTRATQTITVTSNTVAALSNVYFTLNGSYFLNGDLWSRQNISTETASNIASAINAYNATSAIFSAAASSNVVTVTVISTGSFGNTYSITSSRPATLSINSSTTTATAAFAGGVDQAWLSIAGTVLTQGTNWTAQTTASNTAISISSAIVNNATLSTIITSTWTSSTAAGLVYATSTAVGVSKNYAWYSSKPTIIAMSNGAMLKGTDGAVVTASSKLYVPAHGFATGLALLLTKSAGSVPGLLTANATYYAIYVDASNIKLASSKANAVAGTNVSIATQTAQGGGTFTLTPLAITGSGSFKWQSSNDSTNWNDISVSSVTVTSTTSASSTMWDFSSINYRYIRLYFLAPTTGGVSLTVTGVGKSSN